MWQSYALRKLATAVKLMCGKAFLRSQVGFVVRRREVK